MKKFLPIANILGLIITVAISYLSVTGIFNDNTMALQSARYPTLFTPAPYAFGIWGLIYILLAGFVIFQARHNNSIKKSPDDLTPPEARNKIGGWFLISCLANSAWVIVWMYDLPGLSVIIMLLLLLSLFQIIRRTDMELTDPTWPTIVFVWWPFCFYAGWITVALLTNISAWLVSLGWSGIAPDTWAILMCIVAGTAGLIMTWKRNMREYGMVGVWALIAVGIADRDRSTTVSTVAFIVAAVVFISSNLHAYRNRKFGPFRKR